jgi:hypothetical protein
MRSYSFTRSPGTSSQGAGRDFDPAVLGDKFETNQGTYDNFTDQAFSQATRTLDPMFERQRKDFDQRAINQGIAPNSEAYNTQFDQYMRSKNDAYNQAAFGAMQYGANRLDADRGFDEGQRQFDASMLEGGRQFDRGDLTTRYGIDKSTGASMFATSKNAENLAKQLAEQGRQFDRNFDLNELTTMENIAGGYRDDSYRDAVFNSTQDQQQFNNLLSMQSLLPNTNITPPNTAAAFDNMFRQDNLDRNRSDRMWEGVGNTITEIPWADIFGNREG